MVADVASIAWGNYKWSAGGCTVHWSDDMSDESNHTIIKKYLILVIRPDIGTWGRK